MSLTLAQIQAAQANDLAGIAAVLDTMETRIAGLAAQAARRLPEGSNHREDLAQDAREALFRALPRIDEGISVDRAIAFLYKSMGDALTDKVRATRYLGADKDAVKVFMSVLGGEAEGDPHRAEKLAQTVPPKGLRLSADRAYAARLAWQGTTSVDRPTGSDDSGTLADTLPGIVDQPREVRPKVGHGAALEALSVLERYAGVTVQRTTPGMFAANLPALVEALEDSVTVPREAFARRAVLDAMAILRSAVSTAEEGDLIEELRDVADERQDERAAKVGMVRAALSQMGKQQGLVLAHSFGINGAEEFGWGDGCDVDGLAAKLNTTPGTVKKQRSAGKLAFAKYFIALRCTTEAEALAWAEAASANRKQAGRK
ncbi:hypothetical protein ABZ192_12580 [Streptomyces sp. NPDC006235]|uniref:hypothetical protein n=1 Tax=Streptomyces sp. NPDC006235 TaxID=3156736 RepID=UPI0033A93DF5